MQSVTCMREDSTMRLSALGIILIWVLAILTAPRAADAQLPKNVPRIGVLLTNASAPWFQPLLAAFHQGLRDFGYVEGQNLVIESRSAEALCLVGQAGAAKR